MVNLGESCAWVGGVIKVSLMKELSILFSF